MCFPFFADVNFFDKLLLYQLYFVPQTESGEASAVVLLLPTEKHGIRLHSEGKCTIHFFTFVYDFQLYTYTLSTPWLLSQPPVLI